MHICQPSSSPTHRLKSDHEIVGILRDLPAGVGSNRPAVDPEDYELIQALPRPDAPAWKVKVWLSRNGVNPETVPGIIDQQYPVNGPERWEAKARWASVVTVPFDHPLVSLLAGQLQIDPSQVWDEILAI